MIHFISIIKKQPCIMVQFQENQEKIENENVLQKSQTVENFVIDIGDNTVLQEERRRTGKALAAGIVIFLICLGLYHAGKSKLSALVGGFIIMFLYVISLLYSSHRKKKLSKSNEAALEREINKVIVKASKTVEKLEEDEEGNVKNEEQKFKPETPARSQFTRTYSIA